MDKINKYCIIFVIMLVIFMFGYYFGYNKGRSNYNKVIIDTTYNTVILDTIKYNIIKKDSIIYKLKSKVSYEIDKALNANDSDAVKQFYQLAGAN